MGFAPSRASGRHRREQKTSAATHRVYCACLLNPSALCRCYRANLRLPGPPLRPDLGVHMSLRIAKVSYLELRLVAALAGASAAVVFSSGCGGGSSATNGGGGPVTGGAAGASGSGQQAAGSAGLSAQAGSGLPVGGGAATAGGGGTG